ncbi:MAG: helix-turn-helix domain-containing protein [Acidimicrobiales bacterium]
MDFTFSAEQDDFRQAVRRTLAAEAPSTYVRAMVEDPVGVTPELWSTMAELGWLGVLVPEAVGDLASGARRGTVAVEERGHGDPLAGVRARRAGWARPGTSGRRPASRAGARKGGVRRRFPGVVSQSGVVGSGIEEREVEARSALTARLIARRAELCAGMVDALWQEIETYRAIDDPVRRDDVAVMVQRHFEGVVDGVVRCDPTMNEEWFEVLRELGRRRAAQSFPLYAVLHAFQVGMRMAWESITKELSFVSCDPDVASAITSATSTAIMELGARVSDELSRSYIEAREQVVTAEERERRELVEALLSGTTRDEASTRERAAAVGYKLGKAHVVVVVHHRIEGSGEERRNRASHIDRAVASALSAVHPIGVHSIVDLYGGVVCAVVVAARTTPIGELSASVAGRLAEVPLPPEASLVAGMSQLLPGVDGIARGFRQARRTVDLARRLERPQLVSCYAEMLPYHLLASEVALAEDIYEASIARLMSADTDGDTPNELVATLRAYLTERRPITSVGQTADRLSVHRHTVSARLAKIEKIAGVDLTDPGSILLLEMGLRAREVLRSARAKA